RAASSGEMGRAIAISSRGGGLFQSSSQDTADGAAKLSARVAAAVNLHASPIATMTATAAANRGRRHRIARVGYHRGSASSRPGAGGGFDTQGVWLARSGRPRG